MVKKATDGGKFLDEKRGDFAGPSSRPLHL